MRVCVCVCVRFHIIPYVNCFGRTVFYVCIEQCVHSHILLYVKCFGRTALRVYRIVYLGYYVSCESSGH